MARIGSLKGRDLRVSRGGELYPYSAGACVEVLQGAGVSTDEAMKIVFDIEATIKERKLKRIELSELVDMLVAGAERRSEHAAARLRRQTPPFVPIVVEDGAASDRSSPQETLATKKFSRRTLMASLEKLGLKLKEAHAATTQVEQGLRTEGIERITRAELARRVASVIEVRHGREARLRYEAQTHRPFEIRVSQGASHDMPYSRGILARSLMAVGLGPDFSHNLAKRVEEALYARDADVVSPDQVRAEVARLVRLEAGDEYARRYLLMRDMRTAERPVIVVIGGAPGVGKSAIASEVGYRLGIPRIVSTDSIREALRSLISPELSPVLHASSFTAWREELMPSEKTRSKPSRNRVLRGLLAQAHQLDPAVNAIIRRSISEDTSLVVEGVHLIPGTSPTEEFADATVIPIVLFVPDPEDHRSHFGTREVKSGHRLAKPYLEHFHEIRIMQEFMHEQADLDGIPSVDASEFDRAVERCVDHVLDVLLLEQARRELIASTDRESTGTARSDAAAPQAGGTVR